MLLRDYQEKAIENVRASLMSGKKAPVMVLSTGGGKSVIFGKLIKKIIENNKTVLWLVHRRNLVMQMKDTLEKFFNITPGIIMAGYDTDLQNPVQLCSKDTFSRRIKLGDKWKIKADIILIDEGHRAISKSYQDIIKNYKDKIIIGCTATPCRADGRGLGEVYDDIVEIAQVKELTDQGYLSPARYFVPNTVDLEGVKMQGGDYLVKDLEGRVIKTKLIGDIIQNWLKIAEGRKTIVYAVNVKHSLALKDEFIRCGVKAEHLDAKSTDDERDAVFNRMQNGETDVICNVALYQEGLDVPNVSCIVMARPTKSLGLYRQCLGRGLRISEGKKDCIILDHGNTIEDNGLLDWDIQWSLEGKEKAWKVKAGKKERQSCKCRVCHKVFEGLKECPDCGTPLKSFGKKILTVEAELEELEANRKYGMLEKRLYWGMIKYWVAEKGKSEKMAYAKYKTRFGVWPDHSFRECDPIKPDQAFLNLMKHDIIKWVKQKEKEKMQQSLIRGGELVNEYNA